MGVNEGASPKLDEQFYELLYAARDEVLDPRRKIIFDARFGIGANNEPQTLARVGEKIGVTRERIRQIINQSIRRLRWKAAQQIKKEEFDKPSAKLLLYLKQIVRPDEPGDSDRIVAISTDEDSCAYLQQKVVKLILSLLYTPDEAKQHTKLVAPKIKQYIRSIEQQYAASRGILILLNKALWPSGQEVRPSKTIREPDRKRDVRDHSQASFSSGHQSKSGQFFSQKLQRDVQYESLMEFTFLRKLERAPAVTFYKEQPHEIPYGNRIYYPDVHVVLQDGREFVVEIKPKFRMGLNSNLVKWRELWRFCQREGYGVLITDGRKEITEIKNRYVSSQFESALLQSLAAGPLNWQQYRQLKEIHNPHQDEFLAVVLKNKLIWELCPFVLRKQSQPVGIAEQTPKPTSSQLLPIGNDLENFEDAELYGTEELSEQEMALADAIRDGLLGNTYVNLLDVEDDDEGEAFYFGTSSYYKGFDEFRADDLSPEGMGANELDYDSIDYDFED